MSEVLWRKTGEVGDHREEAGYISFQQRQLAPVFLKNRHHWMNHLGCLSYCDFDLFEASTESKREVSYDSNHTSQMML